MRAGVNSPRQFLFLALVSGGLVSSVMTLVVGLGNGIVFKQKSTIQGTYATGGRRGLDVDYEGEE